MTLRHPTAVIHPDVKIGNNVTIEAYAVIDSPWVILEDNVTIKAHAYISGRTRIKKGAKIWPFASIGADPQQFPVQEEVTYVEIGENTLVRESVTINSATGIGSSVIVGNHCLIMAYCHIAKNCHVGNHVIMANAATLAGHVEVGDYAILGGHTAYHQHTRIGPYCMVGGGSMVGQDIPPFCIGRGYPFELSGLNVIGLKRNRFTLEERKTLSQIFRITFKSGLSWREAKSAILQSVEVTPHVTMWIEFCDKSQRGLAQYRGRKKEVANPELIAI
jgi:UDP-N-acetylglucosamine acyltransferase